MQNNTFSGLFVGQNLIILPEIGSTNTFLKDALSKSTPLLEGTVIMAVNQSSGRGQQKNSWVSEPGKNLTFSILLSPHFLRPDQQFELSRVVCLGLNDMLRRYKGDRATIKWPNDAYVDNNKIAGILIENIISGMQIRHSIIGIGLNVNQTYFPLSLKNVTSLKKGLQEDYNLMDLLGEICSRIESRYLQLRSGNTNTIHHDFLERLYLLNEWSHFKVDKTVFEGRIVGVNTRGQLEVECAGGVRTFNNKEIEFLTD